MNGEIEGLQAQIRTNEEGKKRLEALLSVRTAKIDKVG